VRASSLAYISRSNYLAYSSADNGAGGFSDADVRWYAGTLPRALMAKPLPLRAGAGDVVSGAIPTYPRMRRRNPMLAVWAAGGILGAVAAGFAVHVAYDYATNPESRFSAYNVGVLTGILSAIIGWLTNAWLSFRNSKKQHTINLLFQSRLNSDLFSRHQARLSYIYPPDSEYPIDWEEFDRISKSADSETRSTADSLRYMLNYYEFIAAGVKHGDLDIELLDDTIRDNLLYIHGLCAPLIKHFGEDSRYLENLRQLNGHWIRPDT
jgi:hypothetical protein